MFEAFSDFRAEQFIAAIGTKLLQSRLWHPKQRSGMHQQQPLAPNSISFSNLETSIASPTASCVEGKGMAAAPPFMLCLISIFQSNECSKIWITDHKGQISSLGCHCRSQHIVQIHHRQVQRRGQPLKLAKRVLWSLSWNFGKDPSLSTVFLCRVPCPPNLQPLWGASNASSPRQPAHQKKAPPSTWKLLYKSLVEMWIFWRISCF